jgi:uncharacterized membrane protein YphA (DoxX/SURF4 family)
VANDNWRNFRDNDYLSLLIRLFVGIIFIYASIDKIAQPDQFARIVYNYQLLPGSLINLMALILPWIEMICGVFIILGIFNRGTILILNLMVVVFIFAVGVNVIRGVNLECGCFTVSSKARNDALGLLFRDIGLLILTIYLWINRSRRFMLQKT